MKVRYWTLLVVAVTMMAGPAWGQCVTVCETGDDEVTVRIYDDEGEPFTLARVLENEYENIFFVFDDGAGNVCVVDTWAEELEPADVIDEDGYMVVDLTDEAVWIYGAYQGWEAFLESAEFWGAGVEGGSGSPDPYWYNVLNYRLEGAPTFGDWLDAGSASNEGFSCIEDPCGGGAAEPEACVQVSPSPPVVDEEVTVWLFVDGETTPIGPSFEPMCIWDGDEICLGEGLVGDGSLVFTWTQAMQDLVADPYATVGIWADLCPPDAPWACDPGALAEMPISVFVAGGGEACADLEPVPFVPPPPPETEGTPVAGMLGLGLVAAACALGGAMTLRKK